MPVTARLQRRIRQDFTAPAAAAEALRILDGLPAAAGYDPQHFASERVQAAIVLSARGDPRRLHQAVDLALTDWRDLLVAAGLAQRDWPQHLDAALGP